MAACPFCSAPYPNGRQSVRFCGKCGRRQPDPTLKAARPGRGRRPEPRGPAVDLRAEPGSTGQGRVERVSTQMERVREPEHPTLVMDQVREAEHPTLELSALPQENPTIEMPVPRGGIRGTLVMEPDAPTPPPRPAPKRTERPAPAVGFRVEKAERTPAAIPDAGPHDLGSDETLVLLSFDDNLSLEEMSSATGLPAQRVHQIVRKLRRLGVLEVSAPVDEPSPESVTSPRVDPPPVPVVTITAEEEEDLYPPTFVDDVASEISDRVPTKAGDLDGATYVDTPLDEDDDDDVRTGKRNDAPAAADDDDDDGGATKRRERKRAKYRAPVRREEDPILPDPAALASDLEAETEVDDEIGLAVSKPSSETAKTASKPPPAKTSGSPLAKSKPPRPGDAKTEDKASATPEKTDEVPPSGEAAADAAEADAAEADEESVPSSGVEPVARDDDTDDDDRDPGPASKRGEDHDDLPLDDGKDDAEKDDAEKDEIGPEGINYRQIYEKELHPLPLDERIELAGKADGNTLMALCYDQNPRVLRAMMDNMSTNVEHARLAAFHHRTSMGLEALATRGEYARDPQVQRRLTRNPMLPEGVLRRILMARRLLEVYKFTCDRDVPERSRSTSRGILRRRFATAQPEERVELIWKTEGRALIGLTGATFDSKTTAMLCARNYVSVMLIQSLARFPATPPTLISHLLKQPMVKRQPHLKNMLVRHPNTPADVKRRL